MKRYSKTIAQQCKYYEVEDIFEYMVETYINGNHMFIEYLLWEVNPQYHVEILKATI